MPKPPNENFVDGGDIQVDDENITNELEPYHDKKVEEAPHEPRDEPKLRRSTREHQVSQRYPQQEYVTVTENGEKKYHQEAILNIDKEKWLKSIQEEMNSLHENHTF